VSSKTPEKKRHRRSVAKNTKRRLARAARLKRPECLSSTCARRRGTSWGRYRPFCKTCFKIVCQRITTNSRWAALVFRKYLRSNGHRARPAKVRHESSLLVVNSGAENKPRRQNSELENSRAGKNCCGRARGHAVVPRDIEIRNPDQLAVNVLPYCAAGSFASPRLVRGLASCCWPLQLASGVFFFSSGQRRVSARRDGNGA